jgi:GntR family phosphonate transport system transcriptional regulator
MTVATAPRNALWKAIAGTLSAEIAQGQYRPGSRLPSEHDLAARFGVNRHTVRHALTDLAAQGLTHSRRGAGVFVAARPTEYPLGRRVRFHQNLAAAGIHASRRVLRLETRPAGPREAEALGLAEAAPVHVFEGLSLADEAPMAMFRSVFPADLLPGLARRLAQESSITAALAAEGVADYTRASTRLTAKLATPVLRSVSINVEPGGRPVEYGTTWFAGDRVTLVVTPEQA